ncbi:glycosyltransferase family 2 protein [Caldalkalibacillus mannanilyticus]|uniref:glycosyltransferase family 2 protein n=1 Tax=Caldalkalibacillus mannanilyticus TaxID=1418 RepID=UPI00046812CB|nr:glycosyltransferase family 2 protein [Caldalkalibacillus mannanilyticus]
MEPVSVIIPAYNEEERIGRTLAVLRNQQWVQELIVVDDGSSDRTGDEARQHTDDVLRHSENMGKAKAILTGVERAQSSLLLLLDADLEDSAILAKSLLVPIWENEADMTIAIFPPALQSGFGLVKRVASWAIYRQTGQSVQAPLCGQRAIRKKAFDQCYRGDRGFGIEVGLTLDFIRSGYRVSEVPIAFSHREMGRDIRGFTHRFKQGLAVCHSLISRR